MDLRRGWQHKPRSTIATKNKGGYVSSGGWAVDTCDQEQAWLGSGLVEASAIQRSKHCRRGEIDLGVTVRVRYLLPIYEKLNLLHVIIYKEM